MTDSAANLPPGLARDMGIEVVPMYLKFGDRVYRDGVDMAPEDFYRRLVVDREIASTSTPAPADFLEAFERTGEDEVVCVTVAAGMSAAHHEATLGAQRFPGRVEVVDSGNASMAEGFVAVEAARRSLAGGTLGEVAARAREVALRVRLCAAIDTFEFLRRSGRVRPLQAYAATMLDIKPVFRFVQGEPAPVARPRTRRRALATVVEQTTAEAGERPLHLAVIHAAAEQDAQEMAELVSARVDLFERIVTEVTPVIGCYTGPGLVGTAYFRD